MKSELKNMLRESRDALQDNILPEKWEVIEMHDLINEQEDKLMGIKNILQNISEEHCTPLVKKSIEAVLIILKD